MLKKYESPDLFVINFQTTDSFCASDYIGGSAETPMIPIGVLNEVSLY